MFAYNLKKKEIKRKQQDKDIVMYNCNGIGQFNIITFLNMNSEAYCILRNA